MKVILDIPENELKDAIRFTKAKTKREAIVRAVEDFNRRQRKALWIEKYAGKCDQMMTQKELVEMRAGS